MSDSAEPEDRKARDAVHFGEHRRHDSNVTSSHRIVVTAGGVPTADEMAALTVALLGAGEGAREQVGATAATSAWTLTALREGVGLGSRGDAHDPPPDVLPSRPR